MAAAPARRSASSARWSLAARSPSPTPPAPDAPLVFALDVETEGAANGVFVIDEDVEAEAGTPLLLPPLLRYRNLVKRFDLFFDSESSFEDAAED